MIMPHLLVILLVIPWLLLANELLRRYLYQVSLLYVTTQGQRKACACVLLLKVCKDSKHMIYNLEKQLTSDGARKERKCVGDVHMPSDILP